MDARIDKEIPAIKIKMEQDMSIKVDRGELQAILKGKVDFEVTQKINERLKKMEDLIQSLTKNDDDHEDEEKSDNEAP